MLDLLTCYLLKFRMCLSFDFGIMYKASFNTWQDLSWAFKHLQYGNDNILSFTNLLNRKFHIRAVSCRFMWKYKISQTRLILFPPCVLLWLFFSQQESSWHFLNHLLPTLLLFNTFLWFVSSFFPAFCFVFQRLRCDSEKLWNYEQQPSTATSSLPLQNWDYKTKTCSHYYCCSCYVYCYCHYYHYHFHSLALLDSPASTIFNIHCAQVGSGASCWC